MLTATDVKATYDKIVFPPEGVRSIRKNAYSAIASVEAPDPATVRVQAQVRVRLAARQPGLAVERHLSEEVPGPGPELLQDERRRLGAVQAQELHARLDVRGRAEPDYFVKDRPYLDGYKFFISTETSVRAAALRSGRAWIEFRTMPLAEVEAIRKTLGDKVVVQDTAATGLFGIAMNQTTKPFTDIRVRKALTWASIGTRRAGCFTRSRV
jgi:peptide/nickel transport system substrate-binding protein